MSLSFYHYVRLFGSVEKTIYFFAFVFVLVLIDKALFAYDFLISVFSQIIYGVKYDTIYHPMFYADQVAAQAPLAKYHLFAWLGHQIYPIDYYVWSLSEILFRFNFTFTSSSLSTGLFCIFVYIICALMPFSYLYILISWRFFLGATHTIWREDFYYYTVTYYVCFILVMYFFFGHFIKRLFVNIFLE